MTLNGCKFEFSQKFALSNFKRIRQVAAQVKLLWQMCLVELLMHLLMALSHVTLVSAGLSSSKNL